MSYFEQAENYIYDSGMSTTSGSSGGGSTSGSTCDPEMQYWNLRMVVDGLISENLFYE